MAQPQCKATVKNEKSVNFGKQCSRPSVMGSEFCAVHGGVEDSVTPEDIRTRIDRPKVKCSGTTNAGNPCQRYAIHGGTVCYRHGGNLKNVQAAAKERIKALVNPALAELEKIISKQNVSDSDKLRAIVVVLDRTGFHSKTELSAEVEVKPWQNLVDGILTQAGYRQVEDIVDAEVEEPTEQPSYEPGPDDELTLEEWKAIALANNKKREEERLVNDSLPVVRQVIGSKNHPRGI